MTNITLAIEGMACAACVNSVEGVLQKCPGVKRASVSLVSQAAQVTHDESTSSAEVLVAAVVNRGFQARVVQGNEASKASFSADLVDAHSLQWQFVGAAVFTIPLLVIYFWRRAMMGIFLVPGLSLRAFVTWLLSTPVQFGFGLRFYTSAFSALRHGTTNMEVLVVLSSTAAYLYALVLILTAMIDDDPDLTMHDCMETGSVLITFVLGGKTLEAIARGQAAASMRALLEMQPTTALFCPGLNADSFAAEEASGATDTAAESDQSNTLGSLMASSPPYPRLITLRSSMSTSL